MSVWQHVRLSVQIRPRDTLACCWDVKQIRPGDTLACCRDVKQIRPGGTLTCCRDVKQIRRLDTLACCWDVKQPSDHQQPLSRDADFVLGHSCENKRAEQSYSTKHHEVFDKDSHCHINVIVCQCLHEMTVFSFFLF